MPVTDKPMTKRTAQAKAIEAIVPAMVKNPDARETAVHKPHQVIGAKQ